MYTKIPGPHREQKWGKQMEDPATMAQKSIWQPVIEQFVPLRKMTGL